MTSALVDLFHCRSADARWCAQVAGTAACLYAIAILTVGCGRENPGGLQQEPTIELRILQGDAQSALVGENIRDPIAVRVTTNTGGPVEGMAVTFELALGDAVIGNPEVLTDANGSAFSMVTFGKKAGPVEIIASLPEDMAPPVEFRLSSNALDGLRLDIVSGNGQTDTVGRTLPIPLTMRVTDRYGNPVANEVVEFAILTGSGSLEPPIAVTSDSGIAAANWTLGPEPIEQRVEARLPRPADTVLTYFRAVAVRGAPAYISLVAGNGQRGLVGAEMPQGLVVLVTDEFLNTSRNVPVRFTVQSGFARLSASMDSTNSEGIAGVVLTLGWPASDIEVWAQTEDLSPVVFKAKSYMPPVLSVQSHTLEATRFTIHADLDTAFQNIQLYRSEYSPATDANTLVWTSTSDDDTIAHDYSGSVGYTFYYRVYVRYSRGFSLQSNQIGEPWGYSVQLQGNGHDMVYDSLRSRVYISVPSANKVAILSAENSTLLQTVSVGEQPGPLDLTMDRAVLLIGHAGVGTVGMLDLSTLALTSVSVSEEIGSLAIYDVLQAGAYLAIVTAQTTDEVVPKIGLIWTDWHNVLGVAATERGFGGAPRLAAERTGRYAFLRNNGNRIYKLDTDDDASVVQEVSGEFGSGTLYFDNAAGDGRIYTSSGIVLRSDSLYRTGTLPAGNAVLSANGAKYYASNGYSVLTYDARTMTALNSTPAYLPATALAVSADEKVIWLLSADRVYAIPQ